MRATHPAHAHGAARRGTLPIDAPAPLSRSEVVFLQGQPDGLSPGSLPRAFSDHALGDKELDIRDVVAGVQKRGLLHDTGVTNNLRLCRGSS